MISTKGIPGSISAIAAKAAPAGPSVEDVTFKLALSSSAPVAAGQTATVTLLLEARGGYHVNQEYPIRIDLGAAAPGLTLGKAAAPTVSLGKPDARVFDEDKARFEVAYTALKGSHSLLADVDFAVCTPSTCVPDRRKLALAVQAD